MAAARPGRASCIQTVEPCPSGSTALSSALSNRAGAPEPRLMPSGFRDRELHLVDGRAVRLRTAATCETARPARVAARATRGRVADREVPSLIVISRRPSRPGTSAIASASAPPRGFTQHRGRSACRTTHRPPSASGMPSLAHATSVLCPDRHGGDRTLGRRSQRRMAHVPAGNALRITAMCASSRRRLVLVSATMSHWLTVSGSHPRSAPPARRAASCGPSFRAAR